MRDISILGIPMDLGAGRRGVDMGPSALRLARLEPLLRALGHTVTDLGNITPPVAEAIAQEGKTAYVEPIAASCKEVYEKLSTLSPDVFPIALGGDHSVSMGTVSGVAHAGRTGVVWIDAHADLNTPDTSPSGNVHGMPLAHLLGYGDDRLTGIWGGGGAIRPRDVVLIGIRSLDDGERDFIAPHGIKVYTMKEIDKRGMARVAEATLEHLRHVDRVHLSFDADVLDPNLAPGVGTPVPGGLSYREAHLLMEMFADADVVTSLDLIEVNPILDIKNSTAQIMAEMATSLLGKAIL